MGVGFEFDLAGSPAVADGDDEFGTGGHGGDVLIVVREVDLAADFKLPPGLTIGDHGAGVVGAETEDMAVGGGLGDSEEEENSRGEDERRGGGGPRAGRKSRETSPAQPLPPDA